MANVNDIILEAKASKFRDEAGVGDTDPIDLYKVLYEKNVVTNFRSMNENFSGMALKTGENKFMLINSGQSRGRQHFTIGHELYHLFIQEDFTFMICNVGRFDKKDREEYNADQFSSCLLMPVGGILKLVPESELGRGGSITIPTIVKLEQHFGVSRAAMLTRLHRLEMIKSSDYDAFSKNVAHSANQLGYNTSLYRKGNEFENKVIGDYGMICAKLFEEDKISETHYFNLMNDAGVNIDQKFDENGAEW